MSRRSAQAVAAFAGAASLVDELELDLLAEAAADVVLESVAVALRAARLSVR